MNTKNGQPSAIAREVPLESPSRRAFFGRKTIAAVTASATVAPTMAQAVVPSAGIDDVFHVIQRLTMGVTPTLYDEVNAVGIHAFIEQQLDPKSIDDSVTEAMVSHFSCLGMTTAELMVQKKKGSIKKDLNGATVVRAVTSQRQLQEVMVDFWSNHFNVDTSKKKTAIFKVAEDKGIREMALGNFSDLLNFSSKSPAMLEYLDNRRSRANGRNVPNENYARELMELHTLGVDGGYSEDDVLAVAYLLSGWSISKTHQFVFKSRQNRLGPLAGGGDVMGWVPFAPGGSVENGESFINFLAYQPATANFVCWKLCRHFINDDIAMHDATVAQVAQVFMDNDTEIVPTLRAIFSSDAFYQSKDQKVKRGNELMYSILRATGATFNLAKPRRLGANLRSQLVKMDHVLFECEPPTGYPSVATDYLNTNAMVNRWNVGFGVAANKLTRFVSVNPLSWINDPASIEVFIDQLSMSLMSRQLTDAEKQALYDHLGKAPSDAVHRRDIRQIKILAGLIFATYSFQIR